MSLQETIKLNIQGMTCDGCASHVTQALQMVEAVQSVEILDWSQGMALLEISAEVSDQVLYQAVRDAGYQAKIISSDSDAEKRRLGGSTDFDLIVIGTGAAGMAASIKAAELGFTCAIIEAGTIGGTCVNVGCIPSKALLRAAEAFHHAGSHGFTGIQTKAERVDWKTLIAEKDRLVETLRGQKYIDVLAAYPEISFIQGKARLQSDGSVIVDDQDVYRAGKVMIATGSHSRILPLQGIESVEVLNSTTAMELDALPQSMIILGGRVIALEMAQLFARLGTKVTILQRSARLLPDHEPEISKAIAEYYQEEGITVQTSATPLAIRQEKGMKIITAQVNGKSEEFVAEQVLMAVGREANTAYLGLKEIGVYTDSKGTITVNDCLQTSHPDIYAAGDVTNRPQLVYVAAAAGGIAAENALKGTAQIQDLEILPEVIFSDPQIATVGLTEAQAIEQGFAVKTAQIPLGYVPRAIVARNTRGLIKLVADSQTDRLLGAHVLAVEGGEIIQTAAIAMECGRKYGFTVQDLRKMLFPYLVQVEGLKLATLTFDKKVTQLSCCAG